MTDKQNGEPTTCNKWQTKTETKTTSLVLKAHYYYGLRGLKKIYYEGVEQRLSYNMEISIAQLKKSSLSYLAKLTSQKERQIIYSRVVCVYLVRAASKLM